MNFTFLSPDNPVTQIIFWLMLAALFQVYFGYPLSLAILAPLLARPVKKEEITPAVTILVCAYNEEEVIGDKIRNSLALDYPADRLAIVVASDGSDDRTNEIAASFSDPRLTFIPYPERNGKIGVINKTVPRLDGEIIVMSDANTFYRPDAIRKLVRSFADPTVGGVSADVIIQNEETTFGESESVYYRYERWIQEKESTIGSIIGADGGMYGYRRELFVAPLPNTILDDFVISMNVAIAGRRLIYDPEAIAHERSTITHGQEFQRKSRVIAGAFQVLKTWQGIPSLADPLLCYCFVSHKLLRWLNPLFLLAIFAANAKLAGTSLFYSLFFLAQICCYGLALAGHFLQEKNPPAIVSIPFYFCMENAAALYGMYKGLCNKQAVKWRKFQRT